jgi:hypothetical protein
MSTKLDIHSQYVAERGLSPVVETGNTTLVSEIIDTQGCDALEFLVSVGTLTDAGGTTIDLQIFHGDASSMSDEGSAISDASFLYGTATQWTEASDNAVQQIGYRGNKRYVRAKLVIAGNTGNIPACIIALKKLKKVGSTL